MTTVRALLSSKKFVTAFVAAAVAVLAAFQGVLPWDQAVLAVLACAGVYVGAQGAADFGKSAEEVRSEQAAKVAAATADKTAAEKAAALAGLK